MARTIKWKEDLEIELGIMDLDLALRENSPTAPKENAILKKRQNMKNE